MPSFYGHSSFLANHRTATIRFGIALYKPEIRHNRPSLQIRTKQVKTVRYIYYAYIKSTQLYNMGRIEAEDSVDFCQVRRKVI